MDTNKGERGGICKRAACNNPNAFWYNKSTQFYYCINCARDINRLNKQDSIALYGVRNLCEREPKHVLEDYVCFMREGDPVIGLCIRLGDDTVHDFVYGRVSFNEIKDTSAWDYIATRNPKFLDRAEEMLETLNGEY